MLNLTGLTDLSGLPRVFLKFSRG